MRDCSLSSKSIIPYYSNNFYSLFIETGGSSQASTISSKDDLSLLGVNLDAMVRDGLRDGLPDMDSNDVDEIFKGVLTDDSQVCKVINDSYIVYLNKGIY